MEKPSTKPTATWAPYGPRVSSDDWCQWRQREKLAEKAFLGPSKILFSSLAKIPANEILRQCMPKKLDDLFVDLSLTAKLLKPVSSWLL